MPNLTGTMIDTETLSLSDNAKIWEIAAVPFKIEFDQSQAVWVRTSAPFHAIIDYRSASGKYEVSEDTIAWTEGVRKGSPYWETWKALDAMDPLQELIGTPFDILKPESLMPRLASIVGDKPVWFRNTEFDAQKIRHMARTEQCSAPWGRRQQSDLYTLINVAKDLHSYVDEAPKTTAHTAMDDAVSQIEQLARLVHILYGHSA